MKQNAHKKLYRIVVGSIMALAVGIPALLVADTLVESRVITWDTTLNGSSDIGPETTTVQAHGNRAGWLCNVAVGRLHSLNSNLGWGQCMAVGVQHTITAASNSFLSGANNVCQNGLSTALGHWLVQKPQVEGGTTIIPSVEVGRYNDPDDHGGEHYLFNVGNGTGTAPNLTSNAFTVYKSGDVVVHEAQGDISMGQFGPPAN